mmetsp:Transcript_8070/g.12776  ORF Transcript_8070/g.12776 Transcript_8070/m.12776 type:complete len:257 (-) Transcript_8070:39-809(-)
MMYMVHMMCQSLLPQSTKRSPTNVGDTYDVIHLEHVVIQGLSQGFNTSQMIRASLTNQTGRCPHGQPSIRNLLRLKPLGLLGISLQVSQRIQSEITGCPISALPSARRGNSRHGLDEGNHDKSGGDVLRVRVPNLPEGIGLTLQRGGFASGSGSEEFDLDEAGDGEHGHAGVFDFGFAEPVEVDSDIVDVGEAEGVESDVSGHGSVKERRPVQEWKGRALLGIQRNRSPGSRGSRSEGGSRSGKESEGSDFHHGLI